MLHNLEATASSLQYDILHPAFKHYEDILVEARTAVNEFGTHRAKLITNSTVREDTRRSLEDAAGKVRSLLVRYRFMEKLVKEWRGRPQIGEKIEAKYADQKWIYGVVSADTGDNPQVLLTDGTVAFQGKIEGNIERSYRFKIQTLSSLRSTRKALEVQVAHRDLQSDSRRQDPLTLALNRPPFYIVGWTLSIRTDRPGSKSFSVKSGGILESNLNIDLKAPAFDDAEWRCRIYVVDKADYNFPHLTSK
jgi:hypothetical protein